jgi:hypothetical protein
MPEEKIKMFEQKLKCKNADSYKAVRVPTCNHGDPCKACVQKYNERHLENAEDLLQWKKN